MSVLQQTVSYVSFVFLSFDIPTSPFICILSLIIRKTIMDHD